MHILRACKFNTHTSLSRLNYKCSNLRFATTNTKIEKKAQVEKLKPTIPVQPMKTTISGAPPLTPASDILPKTQPLFPPVVEKDPLATSVPFDEVPGPKLLQQIAKIWGYIPVISNQVTSSTIQYMLGANKILGSQLNWGRNAFLFRWLLSEYGPIVRLQGPFGGDVVILSRPEDALSVFASEGRYPIRSSLDCIEKYRLQYRRYKHAGPFVMHGEDWEKLRSQVVSTLNNSAGYQFKKVEHASNNFILRIKKIKNRQDEVPSNFCEELSKWSLESLCAVICGHKVGFINQKEAAITTSESSRLLKAYYGATGAIRRCESGLHLWKFVETPAWKALVKHCDAVDSILSKYLHEAEDNVKNKKEQTLPFAKDGIPLMEAMLLQEGMFREDILTVFLDMILIGVSATTHSMAFLFYHLARCPRAQRILAEEIRTAPEILNLQELAKLKYLQACIKESLRLKPPIPFLSRILTRDIVVHNYRIPKGTVMLLATYLSSVREEHFDDALKFIPERWLNSDMNPDSSFACIPFGYGPKACLAKNLAEMQLSILLTKVMRNFKIEYHYGDINSTNKMLACPDRALKFRFVNRLM